MAFWRYAVIILRFCYAAAALNAVLSDSTTNYSYRCAGGQLSENITIPLYLQEPLPDNLYLRLIANKSGKVILSCSFNTCWGNQGNEAVKAERFRIVIINRTNEVNIQITALSPSDLGEYSLELIDSNCIQKIIFSLSLGKDGTCTKITDTIFQNLTSHNTSLSCVDTELHTTTPSDIHRDNSTLTEIPVPESSVTKQTGNQPVTSTQSTSANGGINTTSDIGLWGMLPLSLHLAIGTCVFAFASVVTVWIYMIVRKLKKTYKLRKSHRHETNSELTDGVISDPDAIELTSSVCRPTARSETTHDTRSVHSLRQEESPHCTGNVNVDDQRINDNKPIKTSEMNRPWSRSASSGTSCGLSCENLKGGVTITDTLMSDISKSTGSLQCLDRIFQVNQRCEGKNDLGSNSDNLDNMYCTVDDLESPPRESSCATLHKGTSSYNIIGATGRSNMFNASHDPLPTKSRHEAEDSDIESLYAKPDKTEKGNADAGNIHDAGYTLHDSENKFARSSLGARQKDRGEHHGVSPPKRRNLANQAHVKCLSTPAAGYRLTDTQNPHFPVSTIELCSDFGGGMYMINPELRGRFTSKESLYNTLQRPAFEEQRARFQEEHYQSPEDEPSHLHHTREGPTQFSQDKQEEISTASRSIDEMFDSSEYAVLNRF